MSLSEKSRTDRTHQSLPEVGDREGDQSLRACPAPPSWTVGPPWVSRWEVLVHHPQRWCSQRPQKGESGGHTETKFSLSFNKGFFRIYLSVFITTQYYVISGLTILLDKCGVSVSSAMQITAAVHRAPPEAQPPGWTTLPIFHLPAGHWSQVTILILAGLHPAERPTCPFSQSSQASLFAGLPVMSPLTSSGCCAQFQHFCSGLLTAFLLLVFSFLQCILPLKDNRFSLKMRVLPGTTCPTIHT